MARDIYSFTEARGRQHVSLTVSGICRQARTYFRGHRFRPAIHVVSWNRQTEEWVSRERSDLTDRAYSDA